MLTTKNIKTEQSVQEELIKLTASFSKQANISDNKTSTNASGLFNTRSGMRERMERNGTVSHRTK